MAEPEPIRLAAGAAPFPVCFKLHSRIPNGTKTEGEKVINCFAVPAELQKVVIDGVAYRVREPLVAADRVASYEARETEAGDLILVRVVKLDAEPKPAAAPVAP